MVLAKLPLLTQGPFAMFYGGEQIMVYLSKEPAVRHNFLSLVVSIAVSRHIVKIKS